MWRGVSRIQISFVMCVPVCSAQMQNWHFGGSNRITSLSWHYNMRNEYVNGCDWYYESQGIKSTSCHSFINVHTRTHTHAHTHKINLWRCHRSAQMATCLISDTGREASQQDSRLSIYSLQRALGACQSSFTQTALAQCETHDHTHTHTHTHTHLALATFSMMVNSFLVSEFVIQNSLDSSCSFPSGVSPLKDFGHDMYFYSCILFIFLSLYSSILFYSYILYRVLYAWYLFNVTNEFPSLETHPFISTLSIQRQLVPI